MTEEELTKAQAEWAASVERSKEQEAVWLKELERATTLNDRQERICDRLEAFLDRVEAKP